MEQQSVRSTTYYDFFFFDKSIYFLYSATFRTKTSAHLQASPEKSRYTENKWICRKKNHKLYFLHLVDILNDLLLIC